MISKSHQLSAVLNPYVGMYHVYSHISFEIYFNNIIDHNFINTSIFNIIFIYYHYYQKHLSRKDETDFCEIVTVSNNMKKSIENGEVSVET